MTTSIKAKKHLGQHFLTDKNIAKKIAQAIQPTHHNVLEVGCGTGILTDFLFENEDLQVLALDIDQESIAFLQNKYPERKENIIYTDFLKTDLSTLFATPFTVIGNFPYNISTQIVFKILDYRHLIPEMVGMFQKEVAERIAAKEGNKTYGILSVLTQAFYDVDYLFTVHEKVFNPPPKVKSAVIRLTRKKELEMACDEALFFRVVKTGFNQRRKTLRNSLKSLLPQNATHEFLSKRPEQLTYQQFIELTTFIEQA